MAAREVPSRPPPAPSWPELAAIRALAPAHATLHRGIVDTHFVAELAARDWRVPGELLALYAATDGLTLRNRETGEIVLSLARSTQLDSIENDDEENVLLIGTWSDGKAGSEATTTYLWLQGSTLTGATERRPGPTTRERRPFGERLLDVPALLRFGLERVEARAASPEERERGVVRALADELSWWWFFADDVLRFEHLVAARRTADARAFCHRLAAEHREDAESCTRAGDHGAATKAERIEEEWLARARRLG